MTSRAQQGGYTLIELSVVVAVVGILAVAVAPSFIQLTRNTHAARIIQDIKILQNASRVFFHEDAASPAKQSTVLNAWWPGQRDDLCTPQAATLARQDLTDPNRSLVGAGAFTNPYGQAYQVQLAGPALGCALRVVTLIPVMSAGDNLPRMVRERVANGQRGIICRWQGPIPQGFEAVCSSIPKPGLEVSLGAVDEGMGRSMCEGVFNGFWENGRCNMSTGRSAGLGCSTRSSPCATSSRSHGSTVRVTCVDYPECSQMRYLCCPQGNY